MFIMALDHTREFLHAGAMNFSAEDLTRTTTFIFLTRWITHICAPVFVFTAGMGARLRLLRGGTAAEVATFLWTRGLWLIVVELTVMRLAMNFTLDGRYPVFLIILWALGWSMIGLAACVRLPARVVGGLGLGIVLGHNLLDGIQASQLGAWGPLWHVLHQPGLIMVGGVPAIAGYPLLPWFGVMAVGFWAAEVYEWDAASRTRLLQRAGAACIVGFLALRLVNGYGDPVPWSAQPTAGLTVLSFLNAAKYPPSLMFLLMTLGPALLLLVAFERRPPGARHPFVVFGRVPFAYYVVHFWLLHLLAAALAFVRYGPATRAFLWHPLPSMGGAREMFPPDLGISLGWTYVAWLLVVAALYVPARWLAELKARRRDRWFGYL